MSFEIGGNLADIRDSAQNMVSSGGVAVQTGTDTSNAALQLETDIEQAMGALITKFNTTAELLTADINATQQKLGTAQWTGQSQRNAIEIESQLKGQIDKVVTKATESLSLEKSAFVGRATELLNLINLEFVGVMNDINLQYEGLADASTKLASNLEAADATIVMGG